MTRYAVNSEEEALAIIKKWILENRDICWYDPELLSLEDIQGPQKIFSTGESYYLATLGTTGIRYKIMRFDAQIRKDSY